MLIDIFSIAISSFVGAVTSWVITHLYWKRTAPMERLLKELKKALPYYLHQTRHPQFFTPRAKIVMPEQPAPADLDVPHVEHAIFAEPVAGSGVIEVLFKVRDSGRNLENPRGIGARDYEGRDVATVFAGLGYVMTSFSAGRKSTGVAKDGVPTLKLTVTLVDTAGKRNVQSIPIPTMKRKQNGHAFDEPSGG